MGLIRGDARGLPLRAGSVDCCVTSPPYFGLRDYGIPGQLGLEATPDAYVAALVTVFREVRRVLKDSGTVFLNLGDSYSAHEGQRKTTDKAGPKQLTNRGAPGAPSRYVEGLKAKDLIGIPWRVAFALQADGWYLRSDIIWSKPNPMPESVTDRPTKAHEYLFLLAKSERYYFDAAAIREANSVDMQRRAALGHTRGANGKLDASRQDGATLRGEQAMQIEANGRNKHSVWTVATMPYAGAHFATMPAKLIEPCILAGCPLGGRVLDPFVGSGTVGAVAERLGRRWVGVDLNPAYAVLATVRTRQRGLRFDDGDEAAAVCPIR